ncbi:MAG: TIGR01906 family membrane protein [Clostridia bacterium]|nr:TIGR01906 family membrane protein [Clostridia bacterium]
MKNKIFTVIFGVAIFFLIISFSIALPIYCRFFYYMQINSLNLPEKTGYSYGAIKWAFDDVMNFLTLPNYPFGTGSLSFTKEGASHFADCKALFTLDTVVLIVSFILVLTMMFLEKFKKISFCRPFGMHVGFTSAVSIFIVFLVLIGLVSIDFSKAFVIFHKIFFPGKDNWQFSQDDEIINILPQEFFMSCAILIAVSIIAISLIIIIFQLIKRKKARKTTKTDNLP